MTLQQVAIDMVRKGQGILAADESTATIKKRFDSINVENNEINRRDYREMLFSTKNAMQDYVSGVILFEETLSQKAKNDQSLVELIKAADSIPGIKVDKGAKPLAGHPGETVTEGLDGLRERLEAYREQGAKFAKWRAVIDIAEGLPTWGAVKANAHALARYAALCQENSIVPIVEPEVLMDGDHTIDRCFDVTSFVLQTTFQELFDARVDLSAIVLKPNMIVSGKKCTTQASVDEVAEKTVKCLKQHVPSIVPGIAFLSGGQSDIEATAHLNAMNASYDMPWNLTYSYGRALQAAALKAWAGEVENEAKAAAAFFHRAKMNGLASKGEWQADMEAV